MSETRRTIRKIKPVPGEMPWTRADLAAWGETLDTTAGIYRKTWAAADNPEGAIFTIEHDGRRIWSGECQIEADRAVISHAGRIYRSRADRILILRNVRAILPLLSENFGRVHAAYMAGDLPAGAMRHCMSRLSSANAIAGMDEGSEQMMAPGFLEAAASLGIDLRNGIARGLAHLIGDPDLRCPHLHAWESPFLACGLAERHPILGIPVRPAEAA